MRLTKTWARYIAHVAKQFGFRGKIVDTGESCNGIKIYTVTLFQGNDEIGEIKTTIDYSDFRIKHAFTDMQDFKRMWDAIEEEGNNDVRRI